MLNIQGVPQITMNGVEVVGGSRIVAPTANQIAIINGVPQTAPQGIESINGALKSALSTWPNFPGWTESDSGNNIAWGDISAFDSDITISTGFQANDAYAHVQPGASFFSGDWEIKFEFGGYDHTAVEAIFIGVAAASKPRSGAGTSLAADGDDYFLFDFRGAGADWIAAGYSAEAGMAAGGWIGETPARDKPNVYYGRMYVTSNVGYVEVYSDSGFTSQLGSTAQTNSLAAQTFDRILITSQDTSGSSNNDGHIKMISLTPNPWS